jgi:hypothetical protein
LPCRRVHGEELGCAAIFDLRNLLNAPYRPSDFARRVPLDLSTNQLCMYDCTSAALQVRAYWQVDRNRTQCQMLTFTQPGSRKYARFRPGCICQPSTRLRPTRSGVFPALS